MEKMETEYLNLKILGMPIIFTRIFSSCGCTIPKKPEKPCLPGESGEIRS